MCVHKNPKSLHKHKINHHLPYKHLHQLKMMLKMMKMKIKRMSHLKRRTMIKGEMKSPGVFAKSHPTHAIGERDRRAGQRNFEDGTASRMGQR